MSDGGERKPMANIPPFGLRMQPDLKTRVEAAADANGRSVNAEIVERLQKSFEGEAELAQLLKDVQSQLSTLRSTQDFMVGHWEAALLELREKGSLSETHREFITDMTAAMRREIGPKTPSVFD